MYSVKYLLIKNWFCYVYVIYYLFLSSYSNIDVICLPAIFDCYSAWFNTNPSNTGTQVVVPCPIYVTRPLNNYQSYIVYPTEKSDKTEEFINKTDGTFNFSNNASVKVALYYFEFVEESITKISALVLSIPITSTKAYSHKSIMSSKLFYGIRLFSIG